MISFVYFDVGGVMMSDFSGTNKWELMKRDIGITPEKDKEFDQFWDKYEKEAHVGRDIDTLIPLITKKFHVDFPIGYSLLTDFLNRFESNESIWPVVSRVRQNCQIGLLTNMYPRMLSAMTKKDLIPSISWDIIIDSSIEGCQKPDKNIFQIAEQKINIEKDNILFVDNTAVNVNAAKDFGWQTFLYDSSNHKNFSRKLLDYYESII
ncbi:MAG: HAD family hydrolase [Candidatus Levybacteria bacterium]|nr:HAD family hydrolase [Candidatus Levybacteria bacterium]